jgi:hypothetical protein
MAQKMTQKEERALVDIFPWACLPGPDYLSRNRLQEYLQKRRMPLLTVEWKELEQGGHECEVRARNEFGRSTCTERLGKRHQISVEAEACFRCHREILKADAESVRGSYMRPAAPKQVLLIDLDNISKPVRPPNHQETYTLGFLHDENIGVLASATKMGEWMEIIKVKAGKDAADIACAFHAGRLHWELDLDIPFVFVSNDHFVETLRDLLEADGRTVLLFK